MLTAAAYAGGGDLDLVGRLHSPAATHADQMVFLQLVQGGHADEAFEEAFELGDELFEVDFNALDGVGANVGRGQRFTRTPRADLNGTGEWARHLPERATGPNAASCTSCHNVPHDDGAGFAAGNVHRDPLHLGLPGFFIQRNTPHTFGAGAIQRAAEEMTAALVAIRETARQQACAQGGTVTLPLTAKGVSFGSISVTRVPGNPCNTVVNTSAVQGVAPDLVVRPFQWKGSVAFLRDFNRGAAHNELGMQAVEIVGANVDGDHDDVRDEMTVGDQTALAIYLAAQPRPTTKKELNTLGLLETPLTPAEVQTIERGRRRFHEVGCTTCHVPSMTLDNSIYSEPSQSAAYRDATFPAGQNPVALGVDPQFAIRFDLTQDQPDNRMHDDQGHVTYRLGSLRTDAQGHAVVDLFGDLKRHSMGFGLREAIDEVGTGTQSFLTENLWGVGSTAPYLHDGRATTLTEAILEHGGEASAARSAFEGLPTPAQQDLIAFLDNLVLYKVE